MTVLPRTREVIEEVDGERGVDYRFSLANERTYLAWIRTGTALTVGGLAAAKALNFHHEVLRWIVAAPPIVVGALVLVESPRRWRRYQASMEEGSALQVGRHVNAIGLGLSIYALVALGATLLDR